MFLKSFKTELIVNNKQSTQLAQHAGCARWTYNWALAKKKEAFEKKEKIPNAYELSKELTQFKKEIPWIYEVSSVAVQISLFDADEAFKNFFKRCKDKSVKKKGFPKFKSKKNNKQSFKLHQNIHVYSNGIKLPIIGILKLAQSNYIPTNCKILSVTVSLKVGKWFVSVLCEFPDLVPTVSLNEVVGVDLGIKTLATCSDATIHENPKALRKNLKKLKRKQRQLFRKKVGSKNREKARHKLSKLHQRIANIRKDALNKATSRIINENQVIILENLKVANMLKNNKLALAISDVGMYEFRRQIEYKAMWNKREVIFVDTFFPSSKLCSCCGWKNDNLTLADRTFECYVCGLKIDRDLNAAINLKNHGLKQNNEIKNRESSSRIEACGDGSSEKETSFSPSTKQEFNRRLEVSDD